MAVGHKKSNYNSEAVLKEIYPKVEQGLSKRLPQWKQCISRFIHDRSQALFDSMPVDRIYYHDSDREILFNALDLDMKEINAYMKHTYYANIKKFNPQAAKDATTIVALCIVRYFLLKKDQKNLDLAVIYLSFSGKLYPSIHSGSFTFAPTKYRHIMEYVVNTQLTNKYELKRSGTVIGAIKTIALLWAESYTKEFKDFDDEDVVYVVQQIHNRIKSFMKNIATLYYEAYDNKEYITYDNDAIPEGESGGAYHLTDNDMFKLQKYTQKAMERINTSQVDYKICRASADANVKTEEVKQIIESILNNRDNIKLVRELITSMIASYMNQSTNKDIISNSFLTYATRPKPNSKDETINRIKDIVMDLLEDNSVRFRKRKSREATKQSYIRSLLTYFTVTIIYANK